MRSAVKQAVMFAVRAAIRFAVLVVNLVYMIGAAIFSFFVLLLLLIGAQL